MEQSSGERSHPRIAAGEDRRLSGTAGARGSDALASWRRWVAPRSDGLPQVRVVLAFPALVAAAILVLVALGITGSSSGVMHDHFYSGEDPDLIALEPQAIRSDEWRVQTVFTVSQVEESLRAVNDALPGGVDMTIFWDVPHSDWSTIFRPHNLGFFVLPLDNAFALRWWLPGGALLAAGYAFIVTLWPRRPVAAALLSTAFLLSPFFQWWYLPQNVWPTTWALFVMTAVVWTQTLRRARDRWLWAVAVAYVTVTAAMGLYVPFLVPSAYVMLAFLAGWVLRRGFRVDVRNRLRRLWPVIAGGMTAALVVALFLLTKLDTVRAFLGTVYPGQRLTATGTALTEDGAESTFLGLFSLALADGTSHGIRPNAPEASSFLFVGAFVALAGLWLVIRGLRAHRHIDMALVLALGVATLFVVYLYVPGWNALAHVLFLDRVPVARLLVGIGLLSIVLIVLVVRALDVESIRGPWWLALTAAAASLGFHLLFGSLLAANADFTAAAGPWPLLALLFAASVVLFVRRRPVAGAAIYAVLALGVAGWVHPLYQGVFDLRQTEVADVVERHEREDPGTWVGVGESYVGAILTETGVGGFNLLQGAPDRDTWAGIDPTGEFEQAWNRLANVGWVVDPAAPRVFNPANDQIRVNFDSCGAFEQSAVQHVLSDEEIDQDCVALEERVVTPGATYRVYAVVPPG